MDSNRRDLRGFLHDHAERLLAVTMVLAHLVLAVGFSLGPIFEGPDEYDHFRYIQFIAQNQSLPNPFVDKGTQHRRAPRYYITSAPFAALIAGRDIGEIIGLPANPFYAYAFHLPGNDNKYTLLHVRAEYFPYTHSLAARTIHLLRLITVLI